jgi:hypothetical protein
MKRWPRLTSFLRRTLLAFAVLATLLALGIVVENWRGDRAWAAVERDLRARGEPLDLTAFQPPRVPDERNFFKAPVLENLLYAAPNDPQTKKLMEDTKLDKILDAYRIQRAQSGTPQPGYARYIPVPTPNDPTGRLHGVRQIMLGSKLIAEPLSADPATDILLAMRPAQPPLDAVVQAARERPEAWLPPFLTPLPAADQRRLNSDLALALARGLGGRAEARLTLGQVEDAAADMAGALRLARAILDVAQGSQLAANVGRVIQQLSVPAIQEGLRRRSWSDAQLLALQRQLETVRPLISLRTMFRQRRAWTFQVLDSMTDVPPEKFFGRPGYAWVRWLPRGWVQQNKAQFAKSSDELLASFDPEEGRIIPDRIYTLRSTNAALRASRSPYTWLAGRSVGSTEAEVVMWGFFANNLNQAVVACALERFRLARGAYPATLAELVPAFVTAVPHDVYSGQPMRYTRAPDGGYILTASDIGGRSEEELEWTQPGPR